MAFSVLSVICRSNSRSGILGYADRLPFFISKNFDKSNQLNLRTRPIFSQSNRLFFQSSTSYGSKTKRKEAIKDSIHAPSRRDPTLRGIELLRDPRTNKSLGFTLKERQVNGIHGLLPPVFFDQEDQVEHILNQFRRWDDDLDRYIYMTSLQDRNEKLFYKVVSDNIEEMAPILYTPTVGLACQKFGLVFRSPRGLYITINDMGHVYDILCNWSDAVAEVKAIVVTDGERILGLGDLGAYGMGIPIGKLSLYTAMGGVPPDQCLPIVLDVGTDNEELLQEPAYIGLRHKRVRGKRYDDFIDEFMKAVVKRFGSSTLVQFEDFANNNAFRLLEKYRNKYLTFNDDIQGTAAVVIAGLISSMKITKQDLKTLTFLFQGAGEAAIGIANLLVSVLQDQGLTREEALSKIWMVDINGLLTIDRPTGGIKEHMLPFAKDFKHMDNLEEICDEIKPNVAIGAAGVGGKFTEKFLKSMATFNERPIIFALSNPTSKAECTAEQAYMFTEGRCIFASGSPFGPVTVGDKTFYPGQGNNAYIFPGVALGAIVSGVYTLPDGVFLKSAEALSEMVTEEDLAVGRVYPCLSNIREVSTRLAAAVVQYSYDNRMATVYPEPDDKVTFVMEHQYSTDYDNFVPKTYGWPGYADE